MSDSRLQALSVHYFREYIGKIRGAVAPLSDDQVWWRPNAASNSIGNLLLHLNGNLSQWVLQGLGGRPFERHRDAEFAAGREDESTRVPKDDALTRLAATVDAVITVVGELSTAELDRERRIQKYDLDGWKALFHVVEHMSYHTGQIVMLSKHLEPGAGIDFYPQHKGE
jgi:uncharacterized damage-inducible protein DinB